jgi:Neuraminidase (sialidase)
LVGSSINTAKKHRNNTSACFYKQAVFCRQKIIHTLKKSVDKVYKYAQNSVVEKENAVHNFVEIYNYKNMQKPSKTVFLPLLCINGGYTHKKN